MDNQKISAIINQIIYSIKNKQIYNIRNMLVDESEYVGLMMINDLPPFYFLRYDLKNKMLKLIPIQYTAKHMILVPVAFDFNMDDDHIVNAGLALDLTAKMLANNQINDFDQDVFNALQDL